MEKEGLNFPICHNIQKHRKIGCCSVSAKTRIHPIQYLQYILGVLKRSNLLGKAW